VAFLCRGLRDTVQEPFQQSEAMDTVLTLLALLREFVREQYRKRDERKKDATKEFADFEGWLRRKNHNQIQQMFADNEWLLNDVRRVLALSHEEQVTALEDLKTSWGAALGTISSQQESLLEQVVQTNEGMAILLERIKSNAKEQLMKRFPYGYLLFGPGKDVMEYTKFFQTVGTLSVQIDTVAPPPTCEIKNGNVHISLHGMCAVVESPSMTIKFKNALDIPIEIALKSGECVCAGPACGVPENIVVPYVEVFDDSLILPIFVFGFVPGGPAEMVKQTGLMNLILQAMPSVGPGLHGTFTYEREDPPESDKSGQFAYGKFTFGEITKIKT
jgi:hypothetical protein